MSMRLAASEFESDQRILRVEQNISYFGVIAHLMARKNATQKRKCERKIPYKNETTAYLAAKHLTNKYRVYYYKCPYCKKYHLTKVIQK